MIGRFLPYFKKYRGTLALDLLCAALTTVCELVLPMIMRYITNEGIRDLAALSVKTIGGLGLLYLLLRIMDCAAAYYMADMGHVMGAKIETDMRRDAYGHLQKLSDTYYNNTKVGQIMGRITNDLFAFRNDLHGSIAVCTKLVLQARDVILRRITDNAPPGNNQFRRGSRGFVMRKTFTAQEKILLVLLILIKFH